jgi:hypothetical protein
MVGARDLDEYGTWESTPTYGPVWYPSTVAVGWAPYRFGNWTWVGPWGWTWVDAAPWGYAPFHYGRWVWLSGRWGWCPGTRVARPVWAPALVGWYGGQAWAGAGPPVYGWVPLGWGEPYLPAWGRCSGRCWRQLNQPYAVAQSERRLAVVPQRYVNAAVPGALTAVSAAVLSSARPVAPNQLNIAALAAGNAPVMHGAPNLTPQPRQGRSLPAAPIPASAQYQMLNRTNLRLATPLTATPAIEVPTQPGPQGSTVGPAQPPRRAAPVAQTPGSGGRIVATPPARDPPANVAPVQGARAATPTPVYGGVPSGRGAYTGLAPTPGPKAPVVVDRGIAVPAAAQSVPPRGVPVAGTQQGAGQAVPLRGAPVAVMPQGTAQSGPTRHATVGPDPGVQPSSGPNRSAPVAGPVAAPVAASTPPVK